MRRLLYARPMILVVGLGVVLLLVVLIGPGGCGPSSDPELQLIQGQWVAVRVHQGNQVYSAEKVRQTGMRFAIEGNKVEMHWSGTSAGTVEVHPDLHPKGIDLVVTTPGKKTEHYSGIYELNGDILKICFRGSGMPRPAEFKTTGADMGIMVILERQKP